MPARAENFHLRNDGFPYIFSQVSRRLFGSDPLVEFFLEGISESRILMTTADRFPLKQFVPVQTELKIMAAGQKLPAA